MKLKTCLLFAVFLIAISACQKSTVAAKKTLLGEWRVIANFYSDGSPGKWTPVVAGDNGSLKFDANNTVKSNVFPDYTKYALPDSVTITFTNSDAAVKNGSAKTQNYRYIISHDTLTMNPSGPILCYEGCGIRFVKQ
jgi:hypothetical protein